MKRLAAFLMGTLVAALMAIFSSASATAQNAARATIPFDFSANHRVLPAGRYEVKLESHSFLVLRNCETGQLAMMLVLTTGSNERIDHSSLKFYRTGHKYQLTDVNFRYTNAQVHLTAQPKVERELAKNSSSETFDVAMK